MVGFDAELINVKSHHTGNHLHRVKNVSHLVGFDAGLRRVKSYRVGNHLHRVKHVSHPVGFDAELKNIKSTLCCLFSGRKIRTFAHSIYPLAAVFYGKN